MRFPVVIEPGEDGYFVVECPVLPGCISQGKTREEALENIKDAIEGILEVRRQRGLPMPDVVEVESGGLSMKFTVILEPEADGGYSVHCPALPGCHSQGDTREEVLDNIKDAIKGILQLRRELGWSLPEVVEVEVATLHALATRGLWRRAYLGGD